MSRSIFKIWRGLKAKPKRVSADYVKHKEVARTLIVQRVNIWAPALGVNLKRLAIRNQKSRWGSCSARGNLNFNYKLLFLPACLRDYIIVHELCHLKELNHSRAFWSLVEVEIPDYRERMIKLRKLELATRMSSPLIQKYVQGHGCDYCQSVRMPMSLAESTSVILTK